MCLQFTFNQVLEIHSYTPTAVSHLNGFHLTLLTISLLIPIYKMSTKLPSYRAFSQSGKLFQACPRNFGSNKLILKKKLFIRLDILSSDTMKTQEGSTPTCTMTIPAKP